MKIAIGSDHGGYGLKQQIVAFLDKQGYTFKDYGHYDASSCDYNDVAKVVANDVSEGKVDRGILICGTGIGMSIQANKVKGIRAALVHDCFTAEMTRLHNDSNVLAMGGRVIGIDLALHIVKIWLETPFSDADRHQRRIDKIEK